MRPIDADALIKWLNDTYCDINKRLWNYNHHVMAMDMIEIIENYPTAEECKHGHWVQVSDWDKNGQAHFDCSVCGAGDVHADDAEVPYCWHCGAVMDEEVRE